MHEIRLAGDGRLLEDPSQEAVKNPLLWLGRSLVLDKGCVLRSYFLMLQRYEVLCQLSPFLSPCMEQYRQAPEQGCTTTRLDFLELGKTVELIGATGGNPRLEIGATFLGRKGDDAYDLKDFQMDELLDLPLHLGQLKHVVFGDQVDALHFETTYGLFEFVDAVVWYLSFQGSPAQCKLRSARHV
jgi:hypothetical protein